MNDQLELLTAAPWLIGVWLAVAIVVSVAVVVAAPAVVHPLAGVLERIASTFASPGSSRPVMTRGETLVLARLLVSLVALTATQAVLRRPVALVLGGDRQVETIEAGVAAGALAMLLALLVWVYQASRPIVQAVTMQALDAGLPTLGSTPLAESTLRVSTAVAALRRPVTIDPAAAATTIADRPTEVAVTVRAPIADVTLVSSKRDERTVWSVR